MVSHYQATIFNLKLTDLARNCLDGFGAIKNNAVKKKVVDIIRNDLLYIMQTVVEESLYTFGKTTGKMASSLRSGIKVKGITPVSLRAILQGIDYTLIHEDNVTLKPRHSRMLAIPLPAACHADGTPILKGGPKLWRNYKETFIINADKASSKGFRTQKKSAINPHNDNEVAYIVYRDNSRGHEHLVFLYKLVPYSIFNEGYANVYGEPLKKLGLEKRMLTALESAWDGWGEVIINALNESQDWQALEVYKGVHVDRTFVQYNTTAAITKGSLAKIKVSRGAAGFINTATKIIRS